MLLDVTERKNAEAELASERDMLRALMDSSSDAIYFKDPQSRSAVAAPAWPELQLKSADEAVGRSRF